MSNTYNSKFYTFRQNNSGGSFDFDQSSGITVNVIIEAADLAHAVSRAKCIGLYFDGVDSGMDCERYGDRWYEPWDEEGDNEPMVFGKPCAKGTTGWMEDGKNVAVHYLDGTIEWY